MREKISAAILIVATLTLSSEGMKYKAYKDPAGIWTVCEGHTGNDIDFNKVYSLDECKEFLSKDMQAAMEQVERCNPGIPVTVLAAFGDAVYNMGGAIACHPNSTAHRYMLAGKWKEACNELPKWNTAVVKGVRVVLKGLTIRRENEKEMCLKGLE